MITSPLTLAEVLVGFVIASAFISIVDYLDFKLSLSARRDRFVHQLVVCCKRLASSLFSLPAFFHRTLFSKKI
jgi:hypothetical protein